MLTLTKKTWKYIFYAVLALVLLYVVFGSTRERFTSVNPLPTAADLSAVEAALKREGEKTEDGKQPSWPQIAAAVLKTAPESIKAALRFSRENIIPLLPYNVVKSNTNPDGSDNFDFWTLMSMRSYKDIMILPIAYAVKQQSSPPTLPAFIDMAVKVFKDNTNPGAAWPDKQTQTIIDEMKKGEPTIQPPGQGDTLPNPGYWAYKYIYGDPKAAPPGGGIGGTTGKCTPSVQKIAGGVIETKCFK
jgi:hypothetical protein